jgi:predicted lipid-binding transport protein (Tim44 family)
MKRIIVISALLLSLVAQAATISRSGGSPAPARSFGVSRPAAVTTARTSPAPQQVQQAPQPVYTQPAPTANYQYRPSDYRGNGYYPQNRGLTANQAAAAGAVGGLVVGAVAGSVLANSNHPQQPTTVINNVPSGAPIGQPMMQQPAIPQPQMGQPFYQQPVYQPTQSFSGWSATWSFLGWLFFLAVFAAIGYVLYTVWRNRQKVINKLGTYTHMQQEESIYPLGSPLQFYMATTTAFLAKDENALARLTDADMFEMLKMNFPQTASKPNVALTYQVVEQHGNEMSIHYVGTDNIDNIPINEVWHLTFTNSHWVLSGIEQV